ncbi:hypothetical protein B0H66DRAFT_443688, partial [Apodospora peruviana]
MLEFLAYKKFKKNKAEKEAAKAQLDGHGSSTPSSPGGAAAATTGESDKKAGKATEVDKPLLDDDDERFLERLTSPGAENEQQEDEEGPRPPLPPRVKTPDLTWDSDSESFQKLNMSGKANATMLATKEKGKAVVDRFTLLLQRNKKKDPGNMQLAVPEPEIDREKDDLTRVLDDLNLAARNNKAFALSADSNELVRKFTLVLKDLVNGVPTAVNDLTSLLDDRDGLLAKNYEKLPGSLKKLVTQLPDKLSSTLAPELLAVAAEAQGLSKDDAAAKGGIKGAAKRLLVPKNLKDLVTKPGAVVSMLKGIMNALKLRWPAFIGTNLLWSLALFLLLFVLWYCHKRGRETRIDKENKEADANVGVVDGADRIEELPDDPALPAP